MGHFGLDKTIAMWGIFYWPSLKTDVVRFQQCHICKYEVRQKIIVRNESYKGQIDIEDMKISEVK